jgi:hypothetical protein
VVLLFYRSVDDNAFELTSSAVSNSNSERNGDFVVPKLLRVF